MAKNATYAEGRIRPSRLAAPVISVGNLSVGGSGKTPLVQELARLLSGRGFAVDVLSRGYGRRSSEAARVAPTLANAATLYGDEPVLLAASTGVPVYVGASRYRAGLLAEAEAGGDSSSPHRQPLHLLDDGFQHRRLARTVDIVLLHPGDANEPLLPAGRLREPLSALERADIVVLRQEDTVTEAVLRERGMGMPVWRVARELTLPASLRLPLDHPSLSSPVRVVAFCGIAHPNEFFSALIRTGLTLAATHRFRDHHAYSSADVAALASSARSTGAGCLVTTEKDQVRLSAASRQTLTEAAPICAVPLRSRLLDEHERLAQLIALAGLS